MGGVYSSEDVNETNTFLAFMGFMDTGFRDHVVLAPMLEVVLSIVAVSKREWPRRVKALDEDSRSRSR